MKLLFIGSHGQENWGDELLLQAFLRQLSPVINEFYINSYDPEATQTAYGAYPVKAFHTRKQKLKLIYNLRQCDVVLFGGGSILKELNSIYGGEKYGTLLAIRPIVFLGRRLLNKPIIFSNIGIGPLDSKKGFRLARGIVRNVNHITVRDGESATLLSRLDKRPSSQVPDAVFSFNRVDLELTKIRKRPNIHSLKDVKKLGINLCRNIDNDANWEYFLTCLVDNLAQIMQENPNIQIVGIPMQSGVVWNDDYTTLVDFRERLSDRVKNLNFTILKPTSAFEVAKNIEGLDILVSERLHALIMSTVIGVPIVALRYNLKVTGVISDLGLSRFGVDINKQFKPDQITLLIKEIAKNYDSISDEIESAANREFLKVNDSFEKLRKYLLRLV